jgi:hypothetical protein
MIEEKQQQSKVVGVFKNVKVIDKKHIEGGGGRIDEYIIIVQKGDQKVQLQTFGEFSYKALQKGNILDIGYTKDFYIKEIRFVKMEEQHIDK